MPRGPPSTAMKSQPGPSTSGPQCGRARGAKRWALARGAQAIASFPRFPLRPCRCDAGPIMEDRPGWMGEFGPSGFYAFSWNCGVSKDGRCAAS
eukprot:1452932-Pyramimonas_sp.AAC.1